MFSARCYSSFPWLPGAPGARCPTPARASIDPSTSHPPPTLLVHHQHSSPPTHNLLPSGFPPVIAYIGHLSQLPIFRLHPGTLIASNHVLTMLASKIILCYSSLMSILDTVNPSHEMPRCHMPCDAQVPEAQDELRLLGDSTDEGSPETVALQLLCYKYDLSPYTLGELMPKRLWNCGPSAPLQD